jgi:putative peptidoglycan lipid II flippase
MRVAVSLGAISATVIAIAFFNQWFIIVTLGPGRATDALFAGLAVPQLVLAVISGSLIHVLVPLLSGESREQARAEAQELFTAVGLVFAAVALVLLVFAPWWAPFLFPGFRGADRGLLIRLTQIQLIAMVFTAVWGVLWAYHYSRQRFIRAELSQILAGACSLGLLVWLLPRFGVVVAAWLSVFRSVLQCVVLLPDLGAPRLTRTRSPTVREAWRRLRPLLIGTSYYKTDTLLDRVLSSLTPAGGLSLLYLGQQVYGAGNQIINTALAAPLVPVLSSLAKRESWEEFRHTYRRRIVLITVLTLACYVAFVAVGRVFLSILIGHGGVTRENVFLLWSLMVALGGTFVGGTIGSVTSIVFYSSGDTTTPTRLGIITYTLYVPLKILAFLRFGLIGLAVSSSIYFLSNVALQYAFIRRKFRYAKE